MGIDILGWLLAAWIMLQKDGYTDDPDLTLHLMLTTAIAESQLNPYAERYGVWPDVSFGLSQRILAYHWAGNGQNTLQNIAAVRAAVFANPTLDLYHMGYKLLTNIWTVREEKDLRRVGGDRQLATLVVYNRGHFPAYASTYWTVYAGNVRRYKEAQLTARQMLEAPR